MKNLNINHGGKISIKKSKDGYIYIKKSKHPFCTKSGYILEHRLRLEERIGRYLQRNEIGHHINGNRSDNRIENLQVMTISEHRKHHTKGKNNPMYGEKHTQDARNKISRKNKGKRLGIKHNKETLVNIRKGIIESWKTRKKPIGKLNPMYGKKRSEIEKKLISLKTKEGMKKSKKWNNYLVTFKRDKKTGKFLSR